MRWTKRPIGRTLKADIDFGRLDAGTVQIRIAGTDAVCDWRGVVYVPKHDLLVFSDLHLEKGSSFARRGSFVPPYDTHQTLARAQTVIRQYDPAVVVCLGDNFHDDEGHSRICEAIRNEIRLLAHGRDWCWITGNHDPNPPENLPGFSAKELVAETLTFRHEPKEGEALGEISGHLHPAARIVRRGRSVRRDCFATDGSRLIMPAFGAFTGSLNVLSPAYAGLFEWGSFQALLLGPNRIYPIGTELLVPDRRTASETAKRRA